MKEDEHTRDGSREMATDIMATSTTKLTLFHSILLTRSLLNMRLASLRSGSEITGLRELASREKEKSNTSRNLLHRSLTSQKLERVEDEMEDFGMFARMMNGFEEERRIMEQRNAELKLLLKAALLDLNFLAQSKVY